jgi:hypothetical protein
MVCCLQTLCFVYKYHNGASCSNVEGNLDGILTEQTLSAIYAIKTRNIKQNKAYDSIHTSNRQFRKILEFEFFLESFGAT